MGEEMWLGSKSKRSHASEWDRSVPAAELRHS